MLGMEKMIEAMRGMSPDEMKAKVAEVENVFSTMANALVLISQSNARMEAKINALCEANLKPPSQEKLAAILTEMEAKQNGNSG